MAKTWFRYFLYFLCPLLVVLLVTVLYFARSDGVFTIAERGASMLLGGVCLLLAAGFSTYAAFVYVLPQERDFFVTSEPQRKRLVDALRKLLTEEELPLTATTPAMGKIIYEGDVVFFWGLKESVRITDEKAGLHVRAPKKLMSIIDEVANDVLLHSV